MRITALVLGASAFAAVAIAPASAEPRKTEDQLSGAAIAEQVDVRSEAWGIDRLADHFADQRTFVQITNRRIENGRLVADLLDIADRHMGTFAVDLRTGEITQVS